MCLSTHVELVLCVQCLSCVPNLTSSTPLNIYWYSVVSLPFIARYNPPSISFRLVSPTIKHTPSALNLFTAFSRSAFRTIKAFSTTSMASSKSQTSWPPATINETVYLYSFTAHAIENSPIESKRLFKYITRFWSRSVIPVLPIQPRNHSNTTHYNE